MQEQFRQRLEEFRSMGEKDPQELLRRLDSLKVHELSELLPKLSRPGTWAYLDQALRDTVQAVIYRKLTESLVESIIKLDTSTARLARIGWWLTIVVGAVGVIVTVVLTLR